jgi:DNA-binding beta-propeller fold protein YncE
MAHQGPVLLALFVLTVALPSATAAPRFQALVLAGSTLCPEPNSVAVRADGALFAACELNGLIQVVNGTITQLANSTQCGGAIAVAVRLGDGAVFGACRDGGLVRVLNSTVVELVSGSLCTNPSGVAVRESDGAVFVTCSGGNASAVVLLASDGSVVTTLVNQTDCPVPKCVAVRPSDGAAVVACYNGGVVQVIDASIVQLTTSAQCEKPVSVAVRSSDGAVVVACYEGDIIQITGRHMSQSVLASGTGCVSPCSVAIRPSDEAVIAACCLQVVERRGLVSDCSLTGRVVDLARRASSLFKGPTELVLVLSSSRSSSALAHNPWQSGSTMRLWSLRVTTATWCRSCRQP